MNHSSGKTIGIQLEEYRISFARCNFFGLGLLGTIGCVAAGALEKNSAIWGNAFFLTLVLAAALVGWSRYFTGRRLTTLERQIKRGKHNVNDLLPRSRSRFYDRAYFHFVLCVFALYSAGGVLLGGLWFAAVEKPGVSACELIAFVIGAFLFVSLVLFCLGRRTDQKRTVSRSKLLADSICKDQSFNSKLAYKTCGQVKTGVDRTVKRIDLMWFVLAAQVTCLSADALKYAHPYYFALSFSFIVICALCLGYGRLVHMRTKQRVESEMKARRLEEDAYPRVPEVIELVRFNPMILCYSLVVPPITIVFGILSPLYGNPVKAAFALGVILCTYLAFTSPVRWWISPNQQFSDS